MESKIVKIGNSKGVILPSKILKKLKAENFTKVEIKESDGAILIKPIKSSREDWEKKIQNELIKNGLYQRLLPEIFEEENFEEITW